MKQRFAGILCCAALLLAAAMIAPAASQAQALDGQWFKLRTAGRGYALGTDDSISRWNFKSTAYMYVEWDNESSQYNYFVACEVAPGVWAIVDGDSFPDSATRYYFLPDAHFIFVNPDGSYIENYTTSRIKANFRKRDLSLKGARLNTLGTEVYWGKNSDNATLYGRANIRGRLIDEDKLPFDRLEDGQRPGPMPIE